MDNWNDYTSEPKVHSLESLAAVERKELEELRAMRSTGEHAQHDRGVFFGYFVVAVISTLLISGALNFDQWQSLIW